MQHNMACHEGGAFASAATAVGLGAIAIATSALATSTSACASACASVFTSTLTASALTARAQLWRSKRRSGDPGRQLCSGEADRRRAGGEVSAGGDRPSSV